MFNKNKSVQFGWWENNILVREDNIQEYQYPSDYYENGLMVFLT